MQDPDKDWKLAFFSLSQKQQRLQKCQSKCMWHKPIYVLILAASLHLACSQEPPAPQSSFKLTVKKTDAIPTYSAASIALNGNEQPGAISPGRIVSIYGQNLGPIIPCTASPNSNTPHQFPEKLCDVEVQIGSLAAGLLYVSASQINFKVPQSVQAPGITTIRVLYKGIAGPSVSVPLAPPPSSGTAAQVAAKMWSDLQRLKWQRHYNAASDKCTFVPAQQTLKNGLYGHAYYCAKSSEDVIAESFYYPVDHIDPKLLLLRSDIRPLYPYPEQSAEVEHLLIDKLTNAYGTPAVPAELYVIGIHRTNPGLSWHTGTLTIFLHHNRNHVQPAGVRNGVILIAVEDQLLEEHKRMPRLDEDFQSPGSLSQATLAKQLEPLFPGTNLALSSQTPKSEPDRIKEEQQTRLALFRLLRLSKGEPEQRAAALVAADQLVRRLAILLVIRTVIDGRENIVITDGTSKLNSQLATYGVHFGGIGHYSGYLDYDYNLLARAWKEFPATTWGQRAFLLLQRLGCATPRFGCDGPNCFLAVIQQGESFLNSYPDTEFRKEQIYQLAQANETWWSLGQAPSDDITAIGARTTKASSEQARQRAIGLYEQLLQIAPDSAQAQSAQLALPRLKLKLDTNERSYFCFSC